MLTPDDFHHVGIAVRNIAAARRQLQLLGYICEGKQWEDSTQGVRGLFMLGSGRIELLENLPGRAVLSGFLQKQDFVPYHTAYWTNNLTQTLRECKDRRGRLLSPPATAVAFGGRKICFVAFPGAGIVEFIEKTVASPKN